MALANQTVDQRLKLANTLARAEALVRDNVQRTPVNYSADVEAALSAASIALAQSLAA